MPSSLPGVGHDVESEVERASPDVVDLGVAELRINLDHSAPQNFRALPNSLVRLREKRRPPAEKHAAIRREPVVVQVVFRIVDHAVARAQFAGKRFGKNLRRDDERSDRNQFLLQRWRCLARISARADKNFMCPDRRRARSSPSIPRRPGAISRSMVSTRACSQISAPAFIAARASPAT